MTTMTKRIVTSLLLISCMVMQASCTPIRYSSQAEELPVLKQHELHRPYSKLGKIQVTREVYGADYTTPPDIIAWGASAVKQAALKMGADAVISHEITGHTITYNLIPATEYLATGVAIKFK